MGFEDSFPVRSVTSVWPGMWRLFRACVEAKPGSKEKDGDRAKIQLKAVGICGASPRCPARVKSSAGSGSMRLESIATNASSESRRTRRECCEETPLGRFNLPFPESTILRQPQEQRDYSRFCYTRLPRQTSTDLRIIPYWGAAALDDRLPFRGTFFLSIFVICMPPSESELCGV